MNKCECVEEDKYIDDNIEYILDRILSNNPDTLKKRFKQNNDFKICYVCSHIFFVKKISGLFGEEFINDKCTNCKNNLCNDCSISCCGFKCKHVFCKNCYDNISNNINMCKSCNKITCSINCVKYLEYNYCNECNINICSKNSTLGSETFYQNITYIDSRNTNPYITPSKN